MKFSFKNFFGKCDQICSFLRTWSHLLKKSLMENFIFCAMCGNLKNKRQMCLLLVTRKLLIEVLFNSFLISIRNAGYAFLIRLDLIFK